MGISNFWYGFCSYYNEEMNLREKLNKMKRIIITSILALLVTVWSAMGAPDRQDEYLGLPGDNLNLYAVMKLFQESETLEAFERDLNSEDSRINNLDLNGDNLVDYITVADYVDGNVHNIVLRVFLNQDESQDVAVFIVEQLNNGEVRIQLIGDEALYGKNYIIEPIYAETPNPGYMGTPANRSNVTVVRYTYYDIATWPLIRFIYHPGYIVWRSSWYWGYYPTYWHPWRSHYWHFYYGYHYNWYTYYHRHYRPWRHVRWHRYDRFYCNRVRVFSPTVVVNINRGAYRDTYSRPDRRRAGEQLYARTRPATRANNSTAVRSRSETRPGQGTTVSRRSTNARTEARPATRTNNRSATRTEARPVTRTNNRSATSTQTRPVTRTNNRSATSTQTRPVTRTNNRSATSTQTRPVTRTNNRSATSTQTRPVTRANNRSATRTVTRSGQQSVSARKATTARRTTVQAPARQSNAARSTKASVSQRSSSSRQKATVKSRSSSARSSARVSSSSKARSSNSKASRSTQAASKSKSTRASKSSASRRKYIIQII